MPVPTGLPPDLAMYLQALEDRVAQVETPRGFVPTFLTTSASLNTASAAQAGGKLAIATDLQAVVYSDGAHWYNARTGALIV